MSTSKLDCHGDPLLPKSYFSLEELAQNMGKFVIIRDSDYTDISKVRFHIFSDLIDATAAMFGIIRDYRGGRVRKAEHEIGDTLVNIGLEFELEKLEDEEVGIDHYIFIYPQSADPSPTFTLTGLVMLGGVENEEFILSTRFQSGNRYKHSSVDESDLSKLRLSGDFQKSLSLGIGHDFSLFDFCQKFSTTHNVGVSVLTSDNSLSVEICDDIADTRASFTYSLSCSSNESAEVDMIIGEESEIPNSGWLKVSATTSGGDEYEYTVFGLNDYLKSEYPGTVYPLDLDQWFALLNSKKVDE
jgi:hypothetical protein